MVGLVGGWVGGLSENNCREALAWPINKYKENDWNSFQKQYNKHDVGPCHVYSIT